MQSVSIESETFDSENTKNELKVEKSASDVDIDTKKEKN